ncbi:hypothetical protein JCM13304A_04640 [Desulfothermus okinawensis JCM 13304]
MDLGKLYTTAMGVMPHTDVDRALELAMSLDVPFWPQLPLYNFYEDMYVQASENFPGIILDTQNRTIRFSKDKFYEELPNIIENYENEDIFDISSKYSVVYPKFLKKDLSQYPAIRGQMEGPISFGFNIVDENDRPILFDDEVRPFLYEFMAKRVNVQLERLKQKNKNAFMFIDEPGLQFLFSALSGYSDVFAKQDIESFLSQINRPRGIHLCGNPDWDFLFGFDMDIASIDIYTNQKVIPLYGKSIKSFLDRGGTIVWGIVPTNFEPFEKETLDTLKKLLMDIWNSVLKSGIDRDELISKSMLSPATCCLVNEDKEKTVEKAFLLLKRLAQDLKEEYKLT